MNWMTGIMASLSVLSLLSMLFRRPWTTVIARRNTPPEVWSTELFLETNMLITGAWAILFGLAAFFSAAMPLWVNLVLCVSYPVLARLSPRIGAWYSSKRLGSLR